MVVKAKWIGLLVFVCEQFLDSLAKVMEEDKNKHGQDGCDREDNELKNSDDGELALCTSVSTSHQGNKPWQTEYQAWKVITCFYCQKSGHTVKNCCKKPKDRIRKRIDRFVPQGKQVMTYAKTPMFMPRAKKTMNDLVWIRKKVEVKTRKDKTGIAYGKGKVFLDMKFTGKWVLMTCILFPECGRMCCQ